MTKLKYRYTEVGYCQVHYSAKNADGLPVYYCLMEEDDVLVKLYRCTKDGEADYPVKIVPGAKVELEIPPDEYGQEVHKRFSKGNTDVE